jgi:hypothetical protein
VTCSTLTLAPDTHPVPGAGVAAEPDPLTAAQQRGRLFDHPDDLDPALGTGVHATAMRRATRPGYERWIEHVTPAGACARPVRLTGAIHTVDWRTGRATATRPTAAMPDGVIYKACGNRRASVCPACSQVYRADTYQLVRAGLLGRRNGVPATVATHPCAFVTVTAPSFGRVHSTRTDSSGQPRRCRPGRNRRRCPHGVDLTCNSVHGDGDPLLGVPLCLDCYDHEAQAVWNCFVGELWRRTVEKIKTTLARHATDHDTVLRLSYAKCAEMQARAAVHFHALLRLDGVDPADPQELIPPPPGASLGLLAQAVTDAVRTTHFRTPPHPDHPDGWPIGWGAQLDIKPVRHAVDGQLTETHVAAYLAKYATKDTEATGHTSARITADTVHRYADYAGSHTARLISVCWRLGRPGADLDEDQATRNGGRHSYLRLRHWAHMLGYGGHFSTKSRRYSTTLTALRLARVFWARSNDRADHQTETTGELTVVVGVLSYAGSGWHTTGDALLANTAAAKAREHRRIVREEMTHLFTGHY